jgi:sugar/nucleoside kinase (ribokinase family)
VTGDPGAGPGTGPEPGARLLHLGTVVADVVLGVPALPPRGGDVLASAATVTAGGGFNVLAAAARQGTPAAYAGAHGTGPLARLTRAALAAEGVEVLLPPTAGLDTGFVIALVEPSGERTFVTSPGAEARLTLAALAAVTARPQDTVYVSGYALAHEGCRAALLGWLPGLPAAARLVVDQGPLGAQVAAAALDQVARRAEWWTANAAEACALTGEAAPEAAARALARRTGRAGVLVRTGQDGCLLAGPAAGSVTGGSGAAGSGPGGDGVVRVPGFPVTAVDTTGAGDTHTGVFIAALAAGADPAAAARRANAAAAISVTRPGPATAPAAAELDQFLARSAGAQSAGAQNPAQSPGLQERFSGGRPGAGRSG